MDEKVWRAYEEQHKELKRRYRRIRLRIFLIWAVYFGASTAAICLFVYPWRMEVGIGGLAINTLISLFLMLFCINTRLKEEQIQRQSLIEKAPVGKIQL
ncbi:MAG: hypothetical protein IJO76_00410 [Clostridia bacterium]|nr:hypothetical protein [Clostridia bacterium]